MTASLCLKRCMPSNDLNSLLMAPPSDYCEMMVDHLFLDESMALRKRQRTDSESSFSSKNPATEALEAVLSSDGDLFAFDFDFDPAALMKQAPYLFKGGM